MMKKALKVAFMCRLGKLFYLPALFCLFLDPSHATAQSYIGIRITPNLNALPKVFNNSPANISTGTSTAIEAGLDYTIMLNKQWGLSAGTDFGGSNWSYNLRAPLTAFGIGSGPGEVNMSRFHNYLYNSGTLNAVYKIAAKSSNVRLFAGPTFRIHHSQRVGSSRRNPDNSSSQLYANDPGIGNSETPDFLVVYPDNRGLLTIMSAGIGYERSVSQKLDVLLGVRTNIGLHTTAKSIMTINMNNQLYRGSINTNSNYVGFDLAFRFKRLAKGSK